MDRHRDRGHGHLAGFAVPHLDNRLVVTRNGRTGEEVLGDQTSYTYQLARLAEVLQGGRPSDIDGSVANAELIDECYRRAGLSPRGKSGRVSRFAVDWNGVPVASGKEEGSADTGLSRSIPGNAAGRCRR